MALLLSLFVLCGYICLSDSVLTTYNTLSGDSTFECGVIGIVSCSYSSFGGTMVWKKDGSVLSNCFDTVDDDCAPTSSGHYTFTSDKDDKVFNLTLSAVKYEDNSVTIECESSGNKDSITTSVKVLPSNSSTVVSSSGRELEVTTGCVYPVTAVSFKWYYLDNEAPVEFTNTESVQTEDSTGCTTGDCGGSGVQKVTSKLTTDSEGDEYNFYVVVKHGDAPENVVAKTFTGKFKVKTPTPTPVPFPVWAIVLIVVFLLFVAGIISGCVRYFCGKCENQSKKDGLEWWVIALCFIIVGFGIITVWAIRKCCCSQGGNGDVKPKEEKSRHETRSGNTRTGQKKPETKKNESKDSGAHIENEQHNQGKKHREQPLPPSGAGAATGTMHGREDSDGAVSRDDVDLQESGRTFPQRPMPDIPRKNERQGHDSKGRGLSANFNDDDHPLIGVNIPTQKAGALEALPEGTGGEGPVKKLKKKKKKSKDQEDEV